MKVQFKSRYIPEGTYQLDASKYQNQRHALVLRTEDGEPMGILTVNLPANPMTSSELAIKDYSENEGVLDALVATGYIDPPHRYIASGHVLIPVCTKTDKFIELCDPEWLNE